MSRSTLLTIVILVVVTNFTLDYMRDRGFREPAVLLIAVGVGLATGVVTRWLISWIREGSDS